MKRDLYVQQKPNGNYDVMDTITGGITAVVAKTEAVGWKVMTRNAGRKNSRYFSQTPEGAVRKYYGRKLPFYTLEAIRKAADSSTPQLSTEGGMACERCSIHIEAGEQRHDIAISATNAEPEKAEFDPQTEFWLCDDCEKELQSFLRSKPYRTLKITEEQASELKLALREALGDDATCAFDNRLINPILEKL